MTVVLQLQLTMTMMSMACNIMILESKQKYLHDSCVLQCIQLQVWCLILTYCRSWYTCTSHV